MVRSSCLIPQQKNTKCAANNSPTRHHERVRDAGDDWLAIAMTYPGHAGVRHAVSG